VDDCRAGEGESAAEKEPLDTRCQGKEGGGGGGAKEGGDTAGY